MTKSPDFSYVRPTSLDDVLALLDAHGDAAQLLAGGQSAMAAMNMRLGAPEIMIDLNKVPDLAGITRHEGFVRVGAMTRYVDFERSQEIQDHVPTVAQAIKHVAHLAIRNRGTLGGSLCFGDPAAEMPTCAVVLGATFHLRSASGVRQVSARDFYVDLFETLRAPNELLEAIDFPIAPPGQHWTFFDEITMRKGDYAIAGLAAYADLAGGRPRDVTLGYFGIGTTAVRVPRTSAILETAPLDDAATQHALSALNDEIAPLGNLHGSPAYRRHLCGVLLKRASAHLSAHLNA